MKLIRALLISLTLSPALMLTAHATEQTRTGEATTASANSESLSTGEIKKIDRDAGKITLKHGPLVNLNMPAMTMVFKVQSPQLLTNVKVGDSVKFRVEKNQGALMVTQIAPSTP